MSPPSFDNIINKFKATTKQAADQMGKRAKAAKLRMDIMTQSGEKTRLLQNVGEKTYQLYVESKGLDGSALIDRVRNEFTMIQRIEQRIREIETEIADLQAQMQGADITEATDVREVPEPGESPSSEDKSKDAQ